MWYFDLSSHKYGTDTHGPYESPEEAQKGIQRIKDKAKKLKDRIIRTYSDPYQIKENQHAD